jgi:GR25 family glycosyltransferase involved in LPS biosynthesis
MSVLVISLARSVERRAQFTENNAHIDFQFFEAIDGNEVPEQVLRDPALFEPDLPYPSRGAYGVALSHLALWDKAIQDQTAITVAEDDAILRGDFQAMHPKKLAELPPDWDFVLWGYNFDAPLSLNAMPGISSVVMQFDQAQMRRSVPEFLSCSSEVSLFRLDACFGVPAYSISPAGAAKFKALCFPARNFFLRLAFNQRMRNTGIDMAMNAVYAKTHSYACFPPLAITKNERSLSTIQRPDSSLLEVTQNIHAQASSGRLALSAFVEAVTLLNKAERPDLAAWIQEAYAEGLRKFPR